MTLDADELEDRAREETGLGDLASFPDPAAPRLIQVVVVAVPGNAKEPAHLHGDLRYLMATSSPDAIVAEIIQKLGQRKSLP